jgi:hypothetical protein
MRHQGSIAAGLAVLAALLLGGLGEARPPEDATNASEDLKRVLKELKELREELADQRKGRDLERQELRGVLNELRGRIDSLERRVDRMPSASTRGALSITPAASRAGRLRLDNRLGVRALVTIDGVLYDVPPLTVREVRDHPAGPFTYEVTADGFGVTAPRRRTLASGETWTLTIY